MELSPLKAAWQAWDRFWFAPVDARSLAAMRITLGLLLVWWWAWLGPDLAVMFHADGVADPVLLDSKRTSWAFSPLDGATLGQLRAFHAVGLALVVAYTLGIATPVVKWLLPLAMVCVYHLDPWAWNGGDRLIRIWTVLMAITPCGAAWSVDAWWRVRRGGPPVVTVPGHGHRLVQVQLAVMYTWTGVAKLADVDWLNGSAITWAVLDGSFNRAPALLDPIVTSAPGRWAAVALVLFTLVFEIGFLPLVAWERTRTVTLVAGLLLHAGIFVTMSVGMFGPASVWGYQAWLAAWWARTEPITP